MFIHKYMDKLPLASKSEPGLQYVQLLAEVEMAWNFTQHKIRIIPHSNRFGTMPRVLGDLSASPTTRERIALMEMTQTETEKLRASAVISSPQPPPSSSSTLSLFWHKPEGMVLPKKKMLA